MAPLKPYAALLSQDGARFSFVQTACSEHAAACLFNSVLRVIGSMFERHGYRGAPVAT